MSRTRRFTLEVATDAGPHLINLTHELSKHKAALAGEGVLHLFVVGSTAALSTVEFEPGLVQHDIADTLQKLIPDDAEYRHEMTWHDDNGHSHVRATLLGPSLSIPFTDGRLLTGEYQQPILIELDTRPRRRQIICTVL